MDIKAKIEEIIAKVKDNPDFLKNLTSDPIGTIKDFIGIDISEEQINQILGGLKDKIDLSGIAGGLGDLAGGLGDKLKDILGSAGEGITNTVKDITEGAEDAGEKVKDAVEDAGDSLGDKLKEGLGGIGSVLGGLFKKD